MLSCRLECGVDILTIEVDEWYDGDGKLNLTISWDETDPFESQFNDWTSQDFLTAISNACDKELSMVREVCADNNSRLHLAKETEGGVSTDY